VGDIYDIISSVKLGLLLHLYQPLTQESGVFNDIASSCYLPLLKLIKNQKDFKVTLNVPLSLLQQMEYYGFSLWIDSLKELVDAGKVEITGSAAYHPLLTKIPVEYAEKQIILNEYGLGYYLGRKTGFEGEPSVMIRNLNGFFPPEMAIDESVLNILDDLGYKWVVVDESALAGNNCKNTAVVVKNRSIKVVVRDREVSNILSFKRDGNIDDIAESIKSPGDKIIALDGEAFGHHNKEGIYLLEALIEAVVKTGAEFVTISGLVNQLQVSEIDKIRESSWGAVEKDIEQGNPYPLWNAKDNRLQNKLWNLMTGFISAYADNNDYGGAEDYETMPIWKIEELEKITDPKLKTALKKDLYLNQALSSDQFWWVSNKEMPDGKVLYDANMLKRSLEMYKKVLSMGGNEAAAKQLEADINEIMAEVGESDTRIY